MSVKDAPKTALETGDAGIAIRYEQGEDGIATIVLDQPGSSANVLSRAVMARLGQVVDEVGRLPGLAGVVFVSAKPAVFIAGADVHEFASGLTEAEVEALVRRGQDVMQAVAALPVPTVAAIHGACMGGGCELALACTMRIASDDPATKIGLPETMLGILPAWGGSTRLPRLIGLPAALGAILAGQRMAARKALKAGLVDRVAPKEHLSRIARAMIADFRAGRRPARRGHALTNNALAARVIAAMARRDLLKKTGGHYPAPFAALDVVASGVSTSVPRALDLERAKVRELFHSPVTSNLVSIFLMQERAKRFRVVPGGGEPAPIGRLAVIGAGVMGAGIAQWAAARGHAVVLADIDRAAVGRGIRTIAGVVESAAKRKVFDRAEARRILDRVHPADGEVPLHHADLVIEAAAEKLEVKRAIFASLERRTREDAILATNTSSLPIAQIAQGMAHPERLCGIHFFNPVHKMQLVEVIVGPQTDPAVADRAVKWVQSIGKLPVVVKDSPGFLVNRILLPYLIEAGLLFQDGASIGDLDDAMRRYGMPMGPMRLLDEVGLDVAAHAGGVMAAAFGARIPVPQVLVDVAAQGILGRKSGAGFYRYDAKGKSQGVNEVLARRASAGGPAANLGRLELAERMVLPLCNEAVRCLEEELVAGAEDVDLGMIMGTGFAPFRGGPLRALDAMGLAHAVDRLDALAALHGPRFKPCALLRHMAGTGETLYSAPGTRPDASAASLREAAAHS